MKAQKSEKSKKDVWIFRLVVLSLGMCMSASLIGAIIPVAKDTDTREFLVALRSAAGGGLASLLAPSPLNR